MSKSPREPQQQASYSVTDLEQLRVLADPLRLRILARFAEGERTTKQVAEELGEKPTRLYHHVETLERVGLIRPTRTRQNRGTTERYYLAVARSFRAGAGLLGNGGAKERGAVRSMASTVLDMTSRELEQLIEAGQGDSVEDQGILSYIEVISTPKEIAQLRKRLTRLLAAVQCEAKKPAGARKPKPSEQRRYRLTLAFFPLDSSKP